LPHNKCLLVVIQGLLGRTNISDYPTVPFACHNRFLRPCWFMLYFVVVINPLQFVLEIDFSYTPRIFLYVLAWFGFQKRSLCLDCFVQLQVSMTIQRLHKLQSFCALGQFPPFRFFSLHKSYTLCVRILE
jgi:hypothetical protein